ncbi:hypothetical protein ACOSQ3_020871 [Xanthoceras sorbifolium]
MYNYSLQGSPILPTQINPQPESTYKSRAIAMCVSWSRVVNTKQTILSPFTKEYRVFATLSGIPLFLEELYLEYNP